jgi:hypothetical protein
MKRYRGWTGKERLKSLHKTRKAIEDGLIPKPKKCNRCGGTRGVRYHNRDYSDPTKYLEALCTRCHLKEHRDRKSDQLILWESET